MSERAGTAVVIAPMRAEHIDALMPFEKAMFGSEAWTANGYRSELADVAHRYYVVAEQVVAEGAAAQRAAADGIGPEGTAAEGAAAGPGSLVGWAAAGRASLVGWAAAGRASLVGWAGVLILADAAEILTVGVVPSERRRGIARALVDRLVGEAVTRGAREAFLEVRVDNVAARQLYAAAGFAEIGIRSGYYDLGRVDAVVMRRAL